MEKETYKITKDLSVTVVRNLEEFAKLKGVWNDLAQKGESYVPWLSHNWFHLWLKYFLTDAELFILLLYKKSRIFAIAPLLIRNEKYKGIFMTRKIELIGNVHSPIRNFLFGESDENDKRTSVSSILIFFSTIYRNWDIIELNRIPEENNVFHVLQSATTNIHLKHRTYFCDANWYLGGIDYSFEQYFQNLPRRHRKDIRRCKRHLQNTGNLQFLLKSDCDNLHHYLDLYDEIRARSWKAPEKDRIFLREFSTLAAEKGWMRLGFLLYSNLPIAGEKWIIRHKNAWIFDGVYDQAYSTYSPGKILSSEITRYAIDHDKITEIDYMTGDDAYKKQWTPNRRERKGITIFNDTFKGRFFALLGTKFLPIVEKTHIYSHLRPRHHNT
jgi:CelD/BcsL family acetyltransferase involved in cellulose biosynthesis